MEINPRIFLSFPWQMVFTTLSVRVFLINILHVSLFLPNVTYSHFAKIQYKYNQKIIMLHIILNLFGTHLKFFSCLQIIGKEKTLIMQKF